MVFPSFLSKPQVRWGSISTVMSERHGKKEGQIRFYSIPIESSVIRNTYKLGLLKTG